MQHEQELQQWSARASNLAAGKTTETLGPFEAVLHHGKAGHLNLMGFPAAHIPRSLGHGTAPFEVVMQERVRMCGCHLDGAG